MSHKKNIFVASKLTNEEILELQKQFWNIINNTQEVSINILVNKNVYIEEYNGFSI